MRRSLHAYALNEIAAHPEVRPWLGGSHSIDLTDIVASPDNFAFLTDDDKGAYLYHKKAPGLYEVHTLSLPDGRGRQMLQARSASLREMFIKTDAVEIVTLVPDGNRGAEVWARHAGFREVFRRAKAFDLMGEMVGVSYQSLTYAAWAMTDMANQREGDAFHKAIHMVTADDHGEDSMHDGMVGATLEGCLNNNAEKAIALYNRWAVHAGYEQVSVVTLRPLVLDLRSCIVQLDPDGLQVLHVRELPPEGLPVEDDPGAEECHSPPSAPLQA